MPETSRFFDGTQSDARTYSAADFAEYFATLVESGVWAEELNALELYSTDTNMASTLKTGRAFILGRYYENDAELPLTHDSADATYNRIDRVVLRLDLNAEVRNIKATVLKGTAEESPTAPALTQNETVYEIPIAQVLIPAASGVVLDANITDERLYARYKTKPEWYPEGEVPQEAYMYTLFRNELTEQEISDIEANPSLMAIINGNPIDADMVDGKHASGTLSTTEQTNLVTAINEVKTAIDGKYVTGAYTGSGTASRTISVGFTPSFVIVSDNKGLTFRLDNDWTYANGGLAGSNAGEYGAVQLTTGGFIVRYATALKLYANESGAAYSYIAFK